MTNDAFRTLMEKSDMLKRSDLLQLLQMSVKVNSMLNKVINKQENQRNKNEKGALIGVPSDFSDSFENKMKNGEDIGKGISPDVVFEESDCFENKDENKFGNKSENNYGDKTEEEKSGCTIIPLRGERQRDAGLDISESTPTQQYAEKSKEGDSDNQDIGKVDSDTKGIPLNQCTKKSQPAAARCTEKLQPAAVRCTEKLQPAGTSCWEQIARKNQLMPEGNWRIWMLLAGRGFGKTRAAAEAIRKLALSGKYKRIVLIANTIEEVKQVMVEGVSGLQNISQDEDGLTYIPSRRELRWKNGTIATLYGAENYQQLRGPQFDLAWVDEFAKFLYPRETFEQLSFALRMGDDPKLILTTTPRPIPFIKELMARDDVVTIRGSSLENEKNLSPTFLKHLEYLKGTRLEAQEIYAEIVEDNPNTLWSWRDIENCYRDPPHFIDNIVIGVDPAMTSRDNSDETGIIVVGKDFNDRAFVLEDASMRAAPNVWAKKVADLYKKYRARKIILETNAGGELLEQILLREDPSLNIKKVRARESKICRAQPVVILYQKNLVFHAKQFRELEMEMATYEPGQKSPDRMDALVWALTDLFELEANNYVPRAFLI